MVASLTETVIAATITVLANGLGGLPFRLTWPWSSFVPFYPTRLALLPGP